ncbi:MAG: type II toxin-antitoxin system HicB family antitoxin [Cyanobacteria bacterium P01_D01_bin.73]
MTITLDQSSQNQSSKVQRDSLEYYLSLKYLVAIYPEERGFTVMIPELPGCMSQGKTFDEAMINIEKARRLWLSVVYSNDQSLIPLPSK